MAQATAKLTKDQVALLEEKLFASVVTLFPDGTPQQTLVWIDTDGESVLFNTASGRIKERNLVNDPRVTVLVFDPTKPYERGVVVRGRAELTEAGATEHIHRLSHKYMGTDYPLREGEQRVTVRVIPERISGL